MTGKKTFRFSYTKFTKVFSNLWLLIIFFCSIPLIGLALSLLTDANLAFQRSGAVLVSVVMFCAYLNYFIAKDIKIAGELAALCEAMNQDASKNLPIMKKALPDADTSDIDNLLTSTSQGKTETDKWKKSLEELGEKIIHTEALAGILGTLIWAFGDLPFTPT